MAELFFAEQRIEGFTPDPDLGYHTIQGAIIPPFTVGETYSVVWDSNTVTVTAFALPWPGLGNFVAVGDGSLLSELGDFPGNGEPFLILTSENTTAISAFANPAEFHMVEIYLGALEDKDYLIKGSTLKGIANAIRAKSGATGEIAVTDMASKISEITGGGSGGSDVDVVYVTFMSHDGTKELHKRAVVPGNTCLEPVGAGLMDTPTRESTASQNFTFSGGWATTPNGGADANALKNVTEDRTVYANYIATTRHYNVRFFDGDIQVGTTQSVPYGGVATPPVIEKDGVEFGGWSPAYDNITGDTDCYAVWVEQITFANSSWERIAEVCAKGEHKQHFAVGDTRTIYVNYNGAQYQNLLKIVGMDHDDLADGSGKAPLSIMIFTLMVKGNHSAESKFYGRYETSNIRVVASAYESYLPADLQAVIKPVLKTCNNGGGTAVNADLATTERTWVPSYPEMSGDTFYGAVGTQYEAFLDSNNQFTEGKNVVYDTEGNILQGYTQGGTNYQVYGWMRHAWKTNGYMPCWLNKWSATYTKCMLDASPSSYSANQEFWIPIGFCI